MLLIEILLTFIAFIITGILALILTVKAFKLKEQVDTVITIISFVIALPFTYYILNIIIKIYPSLRNLN